MSQSFARQRPHREVVALVMLLFSHSSFSDEEISVKDHFDEYQQFLRHKDTHFFVEDGLLWDKYDLLIRQGEMVSGGCRTKTTTQIPPNSIANSTDQQIISVEQAVNGTTCQSLIRRGHLLPGMKIPSPHRAS